MRYLTLTVKEKKKPRKRIIIESCFSNDRIIEIFSEVHPEWKIINIKESSKKIKEKLAS